jgi:sulfur-carrier protein
MIAVELFAQPRSIVGHEQLMIDVSLPQTAAEILRAIGRAVPELLPLLPSCRLAVNERYVAETTVVNLSDTIALIPPVSGG